jgi:hypothetical protein
MKLRVWRTNIVEMLPHCKMVMVNTYFICIFLTNKNLVHSTTIKTDCALNKNQTDACDNALNGCFEEITSERTITTCCCSTESCNHNEYKIGVNLVAPIAADSKNTLPCVIKVQYRDRLFRERTFPESSCKAEKWCRTITISQFDINGNGILLVIINSNLKRQ